VRAARRPDQRGDAAARAGKKGRARIEMADAVLGAHAEGGLRCAIGRSADCYGPRGTTSTVGDKIMKSALRGKRAPARLARRAPHAQVAKVLEVGEIAASERDAGVRRMRVPRRASTPSM
jgi:hypothetical protein